MKILLNREEIIPYLRLFFGVIDKKQHVPILFHLLIECENDCCYITGTNLDISLTIKLYQVKVISPGNCTVPYRIFSEMCRSFSGENVLDMVCLDKSVVRINVGKSEVKLRSLNEEEFPIRKSTDNEFKKLKKVHVGQENLFYLLKNSIFSIAQDDVRPFLNGMLLDFYGNTMTAVATNGHRISVISVDIDSVFEERVQRIVPRKTVIEMAILAGELNISDFYIDEKVIIIGNDNCVLKSGLIDFPYPKYENLVLKDSNKTFTFSKEEFLASVNRASIIYSESNFNAEFNIIPGDDCRGEGILSIVSINNNQERVDETVNIKFLDAENCFKVRIKLNCSYIKDAVNACNTEFVKITVENLRDRVLIEELGGVRNVKFALMPIF